MNKLHTRQILAEVEQPYLKAKIPDFRPGDTLRLSVKVVEGESERIQPFEGVVIRRKGAGLSETFTVRKISFGIGIERTFPIHSPRIEKIEVLKSGHARRSRLYYLRKLTGKAARLTEKEVSAESSADSSPKEIKPDTQKQDSPEPVVSG